MGDDNTRRGFLAGRILARNLISTLTGKNPETVNFRIESNGKPRHIGSPELYFSISHSRNLAICAVSALPVGTDIQFREVSRDRQAIANSYFHSEELTYLMNEDTKFDAELFYDFWVAKEAILKLKGFGVWDIEELQPLHPVGKDKPHCAVIHRIRPDYVLAVSSNPGEKQTDIEINKNYPLPDKWKMEAPRLFTTFK